MVVDDPHTLLIGHVRNGSEPSVEHDTPAQGITEPLSVIGAAVLKNPGAESR